MTGCQVSRITGRAPRFRFVAIVSYNSFYTTTIKKSDPATRFFPNCKEITPFRARLSFLLIFYSLRT
jgi:hypothetical protein